MTATPHPTPRRTGPVLVLAAVALALGSGFSACTKHDGLILLDLRSSGPYGAPVAHIRMSAKGWPTRSVTGTLSPAGFRVGYYGPADGGPVTVTVEALDGVDCVLGAGSATVASLASGATSDPLTVFVRPQAGNGCAVVDAGSDAGGGQDAGGDDASGDDAGGDAAADGATNDDACVPIACGAAPVHVDRNPGTCTYPLPCGLLGAAGLHVVANGVELPKDAANDSWSYGDSGTATVSINGDLCANILSGTSVDVTVTPTCPP